MNLLFICEYYYPHIGGVEVVFQNLAEQLVKRGHHVEIITTRVKGSKKYEILNGVKIYRIFVFETADRYWFSFFAIPKVLQLAKKASIIHTTLYTAAFPAWIARKLLHKKAILSVHEVFGSRWQNLFEMNIVSSYIHHFLEWLLLRLSFDQYVVISESTKHDLLASKKGIQVEKIYNGIDDSLLDRKKYDRNAIRKILGFNKEFVYLFFGRPGISKGLEYLIKAVPKICSKISSSKMLLILSRKPMSGYQKIINLIKELQIGSHIKIMESVPREQIPEIITSADVTVIPSLAEGFGFSACEASYLASPLVATNAGSLPEVVFGKVVFVEPKSSRALAEGIYKAYKGKFQIIPRKEFSWERAVDQYEGLYRRLSVNNLKFKVQNSK